MPLSDACSKRAQAENIKFIAPNALSNNYAVVGDGQYVVDMMRFLNDSGLNLPRAIYVRNFNELLPAHLQHKEQELKNQVHEQLILGTNSFHFQILQRIDGLIAADTEICDVLLDKGLSDSKTLPYFWRTEPESNHYILLVTLYPKVVVDGYLKSFIEFVKNKGLSLFVRHPLQSITDDCVSDARSIIVWNGSGAIYQSFITRCEKLSKNITYSECGFFPQAKHFYFDREGVNCLGQLNADEFTWLQVSHFENLTRCRKRFFCNVEAFQWPCEYVLVALQVPNDSNVLLNSDFTNGMQEFIDLVLQKYDGQCLLFKTHPKDRMVKNYNFGSGQRIEGDVLSLILGATKVVSINSSVLYEAALAGVTIECFGNSLLKTHAKEHQALLCAMVNRQFSVDKSEFTEQELSRFSWFLEDGLLREISSCKE